MVAVLKGMYQSGYLHYGGIYSRAEKTIPKLRSDTMSVGEGIIATISSICLMLLINLNCREKVVVPINEDAKAQRIRAIVHNFPSGSSEARKIRENLIGKIIEEE
jgi:hypothetical protein